MKKFVSLLLALVLTCALCVSAFAEDIAAGDITIAKPDLAVTAPEMRDDSTLAAYSSGDVVSINGNTYTVEAGGLRYVLQLDPTLGYNCMTQDYVASFASYFKYSDPEAVWRELVMANDFKLFLHNVNYNTFAYVWCLGADGGSQKVGNLSGTSDELVTLYMDVFADAFGADTAEAWRFGDMVWFRFNDFFYLTIVGGQYVVCQWEGENAMTSGDAEDMADLLTGLTITAR